MGGEIHPQRYGASPVSAHRDSHCRKDGDSADIQSTGVCQDQSTGGFQRRTGCPILVNTSFNVRGEPIVCTPEDAYRCFLGTEMDVLVLEDAILLKDDVEQKLDAATREKYLAQFQLD